MKAGVLVNPKSAKGSRKGRALEQAMNGLPHVLTRRIDDFARLPELLAEFAAADVELIVVSGGDGTVQAVQTLLAEGGIYTILPRLAVLPHGTTNMTASDVGLRHTKPDRIADLLSRPGYLKRATDVRLRRTVRVENLHGVAPQHGMFFGTGAIYRAVLLCQRDVHGMGLKGEFATGVTLLTAVARSLFSRAAQDDPDRIDRAYAMAIRADGEVKASFDQLLFLATTLDRLILGMRPYWNCDPKRLRVTTVAYPHPNVLRYLLPVMYGIPSRNFPEPDFMSFSADTIGLTTQASLVMDGELFEPPASGEIGISTGPEFEYLCG
jgi:hypothetical protein